MMQVNIEYVAYALFIGYILGRAVAAHQEHERRSSKLVRYLEQQRDTRGDRK